MEPKRILVVDPSQQSREAISNIFDLRGDHLIFAKDEPEALELYHDLQFDLVLIEVLLPRGSGYSLCNQIRKMSRDEGLTTPILLMGAVLRNFTLAHEAKIKYGADDILVKPFEARDLQIKLAHYLDGIPLEEIKAEQAVDLATDGSAKASDEPKVESFVEPLRISGSISKIPFVRLLGGLWKLGETGVLHLHSGKVGKQLLFQKGNLLFVAGGSRRETLGWLLEREGILTPTELLSCLTKMKDSNKKLGEILLENQKITPHLLFQMLQKENEAKIRNLIRWRDGQYYFEPAARIDSLEVVPLTFDCGKLLREGIADLHNEQTLEAEFDLLREATIRRRLNDDPLIEKLHFSRREAKIWHSLNDRRTVADVILRSDLSPYRSRQFLYLLLCIDALAFDRPVWKESRQYDLLSEAGVSDAAYPRDIAGRFGDVASCLNETMFDLPWIKGEDLATRHQNACRGLFEHHAFPQAGTLIRTKAFTTFARLAQAYNQLSGGQSAPLEQRSYFAETEVARAKVLEAELLFQEGMEAFLEANYLLASDRFQAACDLDENTADYRAYLGYAIYRQKGEQDQSEPTSAIRYLSKALELDAHLPDAYLFLGHIHWDLGQDKNAERYYEEVLYYEPNNVEALQQLRLTFANRQAAQADERDQARQTPELQEYQKNIKAFFTEIQTRDYFSILGVDRDIDPRDLKKIYFNRAAEFRSAAWYAQADELSREQADEIFNHLTAAYTILSDEASRRKYLSELERLQQIAASPSNEDESHAKRVEAVFKRGKRAFETEDYKEAINLFGQAHELVPQNAEYLTWLGYARYEQIRQSNQENDTQKTLAKVELRNALALDPGNAETSFILGKVYLAENKLKLAAEQFDNALLQWPDHLDALRAYHRIHSTRRRETPVKNEQSLANEQVRTYYQLSRSLDDLGRKSLFSVLNVTEKTSLDEIKKAYEERNAGVMLALNPHQLDSDLRFRVEEIRERLTFAYRVLADRHLRDCYLEACSAPLVRVEEVVPESHPVSAAMAAETETEEQPVGDAANDQSAFWHRLRGRFRKKNPS